MTYTEIFRFLNIFVLSYDGYVGYSYISYMIEIAFYHGQYQLSTLLLVSLYLLRVSLSKIDVEAHYCLFFFIHCGFHYRKLM